jgi:hypothetical protein
MYLFGGRLVAQRRMVADLYRFHLAEHRWEYLPAPETDPNAPPPRYFHSADVWNGHLVIFGGMGYASSPNTPEDLCVLSDVRLYSLADACWLAAPPTPSSATTLGPDLALDPTLSGGPDSELTPRARYAHLSAVSANHLYIIGGQDMSNAWLDDIHVFDLPTRAWVSRVPYPRHCGTYRSVAVCAPERVVNPPRVFANIHDDGPGNQDELVELPFTADATPECPNNIYLYSNHNVRLLPMAIVCLVGHTGFSSQMSNASSKHSIPHPRSPTAHFPSPTPLHSLLVLLCRQACDSLLALCLAPICSLPAPISPILFSRIRSGLLTCGHTPGLVLIPAPHFREVHGAAALSGEKLAGL